MKKELILCFNKTQALALVEDVSGDASSFLNMSDQLDQYYIPRYMAEVSEELVHPIPYFAVVNEEGKILLYQRGKGVGESRLAGKHSIGFGGHVELSKDCLSVKYYTTKSIKDSITSAQINESEEELEAEWIEDFHHLKVIYDSTDEVGKVHLGVASFLLVKSATTNEEQLVDMGFYSKVEIISMQESGIINLENWSLELLEML